MALRFGLKMPVSAPRFPYVEEVILFLSLFGHLLLVGVRIHQC